MCEGIIIILAQNQATVKNNLEVLEPEDIEHPDLEVLATALGHGLLRGEPGVELLDQPVEQRLVDVLGDTVAEAFDRGGG